MLIRVLDFETTGLPETEGSAICEIGYCDVVRSTSESEWRVCQPWSALCNPGCPIPPEIRAVHHISDADVANADPARHYLGVLRDGDPAAFAAHIAKFEQHFFQGGTIPWICTHKVACRLWPDAPSLSNQVLRYWLGLELPDEQAMPPHRAGPDAFVTAHILAKVLNLGTATVDDMIRWSSGPPLLPKVMFGKHRGAKWDDVPTDYLDWLANKSDMDNDIKANARHHLKRRAAEAAAQAQPAEGAAA